MNKLPDRPASHDVAAFLARVNSLPAVRPAAGRAGRLLFAIDATASRQPTWDRACGLTADMFSAVKQVGGLAVSQALTLFVTPVLYLGFESLAERLRRGRRRPAPGAIPGAGPTRALATMEPPR